MWELGPIDWCVAVLYVGNNEARSICEEVRSTLKGVQEREIEGGEKEGGAWGPPAYPIRRKE